MDFQNRNSRRNTSMDFQMPPREWSYKQHDAELRGESLLSRLGYEASLRSAPSSSDSEFDAELQAGGGSADLDLSARLSMKPVWQGAGNLQAQLESVHDDLDSIGALLGESDDSEEEDYDDEGDEEDDEEMSEAIDALVEYSMLLAEHAPDLCDEDAVFADHYNEALLEEDANTATRIFMRNGKPQLVKKMVPVKVSPDLISAMRKKAEKFPVLFDENKTLYREMPNILTKTIREINSIRYNNAKKFGGPGLTAADFKNLMNNTTKLFMDAVKKADLNVPGVEFGVRGLVKQLFTWFVAKFIYKRERSIIRDVGRLVAGALQFYASSWLTSPLMKAKAAWKLGKKGFNAIRNKLRGVQEELHQVMLQRLEESY